jgi:hypothetical protein
LTTFRPRGMVLSGRRAPDFRWAPECGTTIVKRSARTCRKGRARILSVEHRHGGELREFGRWVRTA